MANEIKVLPGKPYQLLFLFPVGTPAQFGGANVVPTPSSELSPEAALICSAGEKAALDDGTAVFKITSFLAAAGMTNAQLLAKARENYIALKDEWTTKYQQFYNEYIGVEFNATA